MSRRKLYVLVGVLIALWIGALLVAVVVFNNPAAAVIAVVVLIAVSAPSMISAYRSHNRSKKT